MLRRILAVLALSAAGSAAAADPDFGIDCNPADDCQGAFVSVIKDAGAALGYKALGPSEATGVTGFGIGGLVSYAPAGSKNAWRRLTGSGVDGVGMVGAVLHKGLPGGFDVGAFYAVVPGADVDVYGFEGRYALLEGGLASPGVALRASYTATRGIDDFDLDVWGADLSVSKGFAMFTPYAGIGYGVTRADPRSANARAAGLRGVDVDRGRLFVGLRMSLPLQFTPEYERIGDRDVFSLRMGFSF